MLDLKKKILKARKVRRYLMDNIEKENYNFFKIWNHRDDFNETRITVIEKDEKYHEIALDIVYEENGCNINLVVRESGFSEGYKANVENRLRNAGFNIIEEPKSAYNDKYHINLYELPEDVKCSEILEKVVSILDVLFKD